MTLKRGDVVTYIDERRNEYNALVEAVFTGMQGPDQKPGINCIYIIADQEDQYGGQKGHATSVVHIDNNPAKANCWKEKK